MNLLFVNRALGTLIGGGEIFDSNSARNLMKLGHHVTIITGRPIFTSPNNCFSDIDVIYVRAPDLRKFAYKTESISNKLSAFFYYLDNLLFQISVLLWLLKNGVKRYDIVQFCSLFILPYILLRIFKQPVISWLPGPPSRLTMKLLRQLVKFDHFGLFTRGAPQWDLERKGFKVGREFHIVEPGIDLNKIDLAKSSDKGITKKKFGLANEDLLGITTARLVPIKNHKLLFQAIADAKSKGVIWNWLVIGDGPLYNNINKQLIELGINDQVYMLGHQCHESVYSFLNISDLFVLTSSYENFSNAVLEAFAYEVPVIGTEVGYLQCLAKKGGLSVALDSVDELSKALVAMSDTRMRRKFGQHGRAFVEELDWSNISKKLTDLYEITIADNSK